MKKKIFIILTPILLVLASSIVFAAFMFIKKDDINAATGKITINSANTSLISYQDANNTDYRSDMIYKFDDITFTTDVTYAESTDVVFRSGKTYYLKNDSTYTIYTNWTAGSPINYTQTSDSTYTQGKKYFARNIALDGTNTFTEISTDDYTIGDAIPSGTILYEYNNLSLYEQTKTNTGVSTIGSAIYKNGSTIESANYTISDANKIVLTNYTFSLTFNTSGINSVSVLDSSGNTVDTLKTTIDSDSKGFVVLNKTKTYTKIESESITCSATKDKSNSNYMYLNQLGYKLDFTCELACFVRIHIRDAWIGTKVYATANKETYNLKGLTGNTSPFNNMSDEWYYDSSENTLYLKTMITPSIDEDGNYTNHEYIFDVNEAYFYLLDYETTTYKEYIDVQVSFNVDIVQANRVYALWGVDPTKLG